MKITNTWFRTLGIFALAFGLSLLLVGNLSAQEKGATKLMKRIATSQDVANLQEGDMIAMACPKCQTITVTFIKTEKGHIQTATPGQEHLCPGCEQKFVVVGEGKNKHEVVTHVCKKCGSKDAFCCIARKGEEATKGMDAKLDVAPLK